MPIIKVTPKIEKEQVRIAVDKKLLERIQEYCRWADITKPDEFFEQAADYVLSKDKDWLRHTKQQQETA